MNTTNKQALSPAEWQSVGNSLVELSERMEEARKTALACNDPGKEPSNMRAGTSDKA